MRTRIAVAALIALAAPVFVLAAANPLVDLGAQGSQSIDYGGAAQADPSATDASALGGSGGLPLGVDEQVSLTETPSVPKPGEQVTLRIDSYSTDLNKAVTLWKQDGAVVAQGTGIVTYTFAAPAAGQSTTVSFRAEKEEGGVIEKTVTVAPADVDIVYQALTYTPPLYRGKALFTNSSSIKFVAIPNFVIDGQKVDPGNLTYTWRVNGSVVQEASGYGRESFVTRGALVVNGVDVGVDVQALRSPAEATARTYVPYSSPLLLLYRQDPLLGTVFERSWTAVTTPLSGDEFTLRAVPYFADAASATDGRLGYSWKVNDADSSQTGPLATFRRQGASGVASVTATLKDAVNFAQFAQSAASVDLGAQQAASGTPL